MYSPTTRVLTVLEMLQSQGRVTGAEIADRLEVHIRTVRRYVAMLEELGIPVAAERGRYGAYRLMPGFKLPPLMFTEEEALATMLGLLAARQLGLTATAAGACGARAVSVGMAHYPSEQTYRCQNLGGAALRLRGLCSRSRLAPSGPPVRNAPPSRF